MNSGRLFFFFFPSLKFLRALNTKGFEHRLSNRDNEMSYGQCFDHSSMSNVKPSLCGCIFIQKHLPCFCCQVKSDSWKDRRCQCLSSCYFDGAQNLFFRTNLAWLILLWFPQTQAGSLMGLAVLPFSLTVGPGWWQWHAQTCLKVLLFIAQPSFLCLCHYFSNRPKVKRQWWEANRIELVMVQKHLGLFFPQDFYFVGNRQTHIIDSLHSYTVVDMLTNNFKETRVYSLTTKVWFLLLYNLRNHCCIKITEQ